MLNRAFIITSSEPGVLTPWRMWFGPGLTMLSRLVCSIRNRSTWGVNWMRGGKWAFLPTAATNPGPRSGELGSGMFGFDWISRWVMVDWLMNWMVREVSGASSLAKKAA